MEFSRCFSIRWRFLIWAPVGMTCLFASVGHGMVWVRRDLKTSSNPLQWAGTPCTRPECSKPHPIWPGAVPWSGLQPHQPLVLRITPVPQSRPSHKDCSCFNKQKQRIKPLSHSMQDRINHGVPYALIHCPQGDLGQLKCTAFLHFFILLTTGVHVKHLHFLYTPGLLFARIHIHQAIHFAHERFKSATLKQVEVGQVSVCLTLVHAYLVLNLIGLGTCLMVIIPLCGLWIGACITDLITISPVIACSLS